MLEHRPGSWAVRTVRGEKPGLLSSTWGLKPRGREVPPQALPAALPARLRPTPQPSPHLWNPLPPALSRKLTVTFTV